MADKIVTLQDKNDNNLYPVAGALHADTVITGSIKDSAVTAPKVADGAITSAKIDWRTFTTSETAPDYTSKTGCIPELRWLVGINAKQYFVPFIEFNKVEITVTAVRNPSDPSMALLDKGVFFVSMSYQENTQTPSLWMIGYRATGTNPNTTIIQVQPILNSIGTTYSINGNTITFNSGRYASGSVIYPTGIDVAIKDRP